jgi:mono/diheme cytochrome c family protein
MAARGGEPAIRTRADAIEAGRRHARERGDRLSPAQIVRMAELLRPHWPAIRAAREAAIEQQEQSDGRPAA